MNHGPPRVTFCARVLAVFPDDINISPTGIPQTIKHGATKTIPKPSVANKNPETMMTLVFGPM